MTTLMAAPRQPTIDRATAKRLMATEYQRVVEQLRLLSPGDWSRPTCNAGWDVRALAAHMLGMVAMAASLREMASQMRGAKKRGGEMIDALTALQVEKYDGWSPQRITEEYARLAPKAVRGRTMPPGLVRHRTMPDDQPVSPDEHEPWTLGYLLDVILTRDPWMHRTDISAATGAPMVLTPDHDGVLLDDIVREWAERHGAPCVLELTGPLQRRYAFGPGGEPADGHSVGPSYAMDAIEMCRVLSGRGTGDGLLQTRVPF
jgi:uncharacterized protein (TIGR03083 family)